MLGPPGGRWLVFALGALSRALSVLVHLSCLSRICSFWERSPHRGLMLPMQQADKTLGCSPLPPLVPPGLGELPHVLAPWEPPVPPPHCGSSGDAVLTPVQPPPVANFGSCDPPPTRPASSRGAAGGSWEQMRELPVPKYPGFSRAC